MMPKKASARKGKARKKRQTDDNAGLASRWEVAAIVCKSFLPSKKFIEVLEKSNLVEDATEAFKTYHLKKDSFLLQLGMDKQEWDAGIDLAVEQFKNNLPKVLHAAAVINASQASPFISRHFSEKSFIRGLANWYFVESREQEALLVDGRGRKSKIETHKVYEAILKRGEDASRKGVAYDLGVSEKALNDWRRNQKYPSWKAAVEKVLAMRKKLTD
jgi:hypothetical protein